jgi:hypothetical protein
MRSLWPGLLLLLGTLGCATVPLPADPPLAAEQLDLYRAKEGYGAAVWGMTPEELDATVPGLELCGDNVICGQTKLLGEPATAGYAFVNGHLAQVVVYAGAADPKDLYAKVEPDLRQWYGSPSASPGVTAGTVGAVIVGVLVVAVVVVAVAALLGGKGGGGGHSLGHVGGGGGHSGGGSGGVHAASPGRAGGGSSGIHAALPGKAGGGVTVSHGLQHHIADGHGRLVLRDVLENSNWTDDEGHEQPPCAGHQPHLDGDWTQWRTTQSDIFLLAEESSVEVIYSSRALEGYLTPPAVPMQE